MLVFNLLLDYLVTFIIIYSIKMLIYLDNRFQVPPQFFRRPWLHILVIFIVDSN